jgi:hypothetical protein
VSLAETDVEFFSYQPILQETLAEIEDTQDEGAFGPQGLLIYPDIG